jgi:4'-phosphopantetheinyl transferase
VSAASERAPAFFWESAPQSPRLSVDEVHVWGATLTRTSEEVKRLRGLLSNDEMSRAERFHFQRDRSNFIVARGTLREILGLYLGQPPRLLRFDYNDFGKPALTSAPAEMKIRFNLSHAGDVALYAVASGREVGVDIEVVQEDTPCEEIAARFFSRREVTTLLALPASARRRAFFECWTRKEAYIKGRGEGLSLPLDNFDVSLAPGEPAALVDRRGGRDAARWSLCELTDAAGYAAAVAAEGSGWRLRRWRWPCGEGPPTER